MRWIHDRGPVNEYNIEGYTGYGYIGSYLEEIMLNQTVQSSESSDEKSAREAVELGTKTFYSL